MDPVYILLSVSMTYWCARRSSIVSTATFWNFYTTGCLLVYEWVVLADLTSVRDTVFSAMPLNGLPAQYDKVFLMLLLLQFLAVASTFGLPQKRRKIRLNRALIFRYGRVLEHPIAAAILVLFVICSFVHFLSIDHSVLWHNTQYKMIKKPETIGAINPFSRVYHFLFRFVGLFAVPTAVYYFYRKNWGFLVLALFLVFYALLFLLADNSRWVPVYFASAAVANYVLSRRPLGWLTWLNVFLVFLTFVKVLVGRGLHDQGVSTIVSGFLVLRLQDIPMYLEGFSFNVFEGALNLGEAMTKSTNFDAAYKIKSFSPFPTFIDGFDLSGKVLLSKFNPMGAIGEVYHFGAPFMTLFFGFVFLSLRTTNRLLIQRLDAISMLIAVSGDLFVLRLFSYSVRSTWRVMVFVWLVALVVERTRRNEARRTAMRGGPQGPRTVRPRAPPVGARPPAPQVRKA